LSILRLRGYLPHLEHPNSCYFITYRLARSIPISVLKDWKLEKQEIVKTALKQRRQLSQHEKERLQYLFSARIESYLDNHYGECWLSSPYIAQIVIDNLRFHNGKRYELEAWCVMPNHVHVVIRVESNDKNLNSDLTPILHSWKSFTAHEANKILRRGDQFWQNEYYDHLMRSDEEFAYYCKYTLENPVQAKLCQKWSDWRWSGCSEKVRRLLYS